MTLDAAALAEALVRVPSPTGDEHAVVAFMQDQADRSGFHIHEDDAGNFIAERGAGDFVLWSVGHLDTVPGHIPVRIEDGELWGRGSVDAKGCLAAAYIAVRDHLPPGIRAFVVGCVDEEGASAGARALDLPAPDAIVIGEPSGADGVTLGYKGILRGTASFQAPVVHGGHPDQGALDQLHGWWAAVLAETGSRPGFGSLHARLDDVSCNTDGLVQRVDVRWQIRLPPGADPDPLADRLQALATDGAVDIHESIPAAVSPRSSWLANAWQAAIRAQGMTPRPKHKTGTADFNILAQRFADVPIVAYGPGDSSLDHTAEERLELAELEQAVRVWSRCLTTLAQTRAGAAQAQA